MRYSTLRRVSISLKVMSAFVCFYAALSGNYPPAHAQQMPAPDQIQMPTQMVISPYDPEFKADIDGINRRLDASDVREKDFHKRVDDLSTQVSEMDGSIKVYFWIVAGLLTGSIVLPQLKKRGGGEADNG
jgi:hypothetical protein